MESSQSILSKSGWSSQEELEVVIKRGTPAERYPETGRLVLGDGRYLILHPGTAQKDKWQSLTLPLYLGPGFSLGTDLSPHGLGMLSPTFNIQIWEGLTPWEIETEVPS